MGIVACLEGVLWITWKGSMDIILEKGQSIRMPLGGRSVVQAIRGPATLEAVRDPGPHRSTLCPRAYPGAPRARSVGLRA
jgi:hypothetical protein